MDTQWYDTKEGLTNALVEGLAGLHKIIAARRAACGQLTQEFVILGVWYLDDFGNTWIIDTPVYSATEKVQTKQELFREHPDAMMSMHAALRGVPIPGQKCPHCGDEWTLENAHDYVSVRCQMRLPLDEFMGRTVQEVIDVLSRDAHATVELMPGLGIDSVSHVVVAGDVGYFYAYASHHQACHLEIRTAHESVYFNTLFMEAGYEYALLEEVPNEVDDSKWATPWFIANPDVGPVKIGSRRHVTHIGWMDEDVRYYDLLGLWDVDLLPLFSEELRTTKGLGFIHSHTTADSVRYLKMIREGRLAHRKAITGQ